MTMLGKLLLKTILKLLAKRTIARYQPTVIGITGSVGKTTAKEAIYAVLSRKFWVRKNEENYNNEFGVPLTVLGIDPFLSTANIRPSNWVRVFKFLPKLIGATWLAFAPLKIKYPKFLVLELASAKPGDIDYLIDIVRPQIGVVTAVGEMPVHVEFYASPQEVAREKGKLIEGLPVFTGLAVLNYDDQTVLDMKERSKAKIVTFGLVLPASSASPKLQRGEPAGGSSNGTGPDIWASDVSYFVAGMNFDGASLPTQAGRIGGLSFKINHGSTFVPARINNLIGAHQLYGILAGVAVGLNFGMNLVDISGAFENIELPHGRMNLIQGIKNSIVIDDTYNASPLSMRAALETLADFAKANRELGCGGRRIAVLGNMRELGKYEVEAHQAIGNFVAGSCDVLVTVGTAAKLIADSAGRAMPIDYIFSFNTSDEAKLKVQEIIQEGDIVLVKGSRSVEMEKVVDEIRLAG